MNLIKSLLNSPFTIERSIAFSEKGASKTENQDCYTSSFDQNYGVFCVSDGIGGAFGGKQASTLIVNSIIHECELFEQKFNRFDVLESIIAAVTDVNRKIHTNDVEGMGATVAILIMEPQNGSAQVLHAGDSRIYRFRGNSLKRLTEDHSMAAQMGYEDETSVPSIIKGRITNAVGIRSDLRLHTKKFNVKADDIFLLCSDGLNKHLSDAEVADIIRDDQTKNVESIAELLMNIAKEQGAKDDVSVMLVKVAEKTHKYSQLYLPSILLCVIAIIILLLFQSLDKGKPLEMEAQVPGRVSTVLPQYDKNTVDTEPDAASGIVTAPIDAIEDVNGSKNELNRESIPEVDKTVDIKEKIMSNSNQLLSISFRDNWKTFGTGVLGSEVDSDNNILAVEVSWYDSQWGVGVMVTSGEPLKSNEPLEFKFDIRGNQGSGTRVYAGVSTLDDANLELRLHDSKKVTSEWTTFSFNVSNMVKSFPQMTSRHFSNDDMKRIQILKLLFTNPLNENYSEKLEIRNPRIVN